MRELSIDNSPSNNSLLFFFSLEVSLLFFSIDIILYNFSTSTYPVNIKKMDVLVCFHFYIMIFCTL